MNKNMGAAPGYFLFTTLHSNSLNLTMTVTIPLQGGLNSMGCPDVLSSVGGCVTPPLSRAGQLVQQCIGGMNLHKLEKLVVNS